MTKGERCTGPLRTRRRLVAAVAVGIASLAVPCAAQKKAPPPAAAEPAAKGAVVSYQELKQSSIVYFEESGGMTVTAPTAPEREAAPKAAATAAESRLPEERVTSTGTNTGTSLRRAPPRGEAGVAK